MFYADVVLINYTPYGLSKDDGPDIKITYAPNYLACSANS